jgi:hypothetical protein
MGAGILQAGQVDRSWLGELYSGRFRRFRRFFNRDK